MEQNIYLFDKIGDRFEFFYDKKNDRYYVNDNNQNKEYKLPIKIRKYENSKNISEVEVIRFWLPKPHKFEKNLYQKVVKKIQFELFGIFDSNSNSKLILSIENCKNIIQKNYNKLGYLMSYTDMILSKDPLLKKAYYVISQNGGIEKFNSIVNELGISTEFYYTDDKGIFLTSSYEFIFFTILHHNNIKYEFEPFKIRTFEPDFYIPELNYLIEILGLTTREPYNKRTKLKEELYTSNGYNYKPIVVDRHNPRESIFKRCEEIFGKIKLPNFNTYSKKYILTSDKFKFNLKIYLNEINNGNLKVSIKKNKSGFREKYRKYYEYVMSNYGTVQIAIKELIGIPSTKFKATKIEKYWMNIQYVKDELEYVFKNENRIPTKYECKIKFNKIYNIWNVYRFWGDKSLKRGGAFCDFIEELKLKYGYRDIDLENKIQKEKEEIEFQEEVKKVVMLVYYGKLSINGKVSLFNTNRQTYNYIYKIYGGLFYYIKEKIGYPPPHISRPKGYYKIDENVKYELEENWKIFRRILGDKVRKKES